MSLLYASADHLSTDACSRILQASRWNEVVLIAEVGGNGDSAIVHERFTPSRRNGNDERGVLPVASRRGFSRIDRNLVRRNECGSSQHDDRLTPFSSSQIFAFPWGLLLLGWLSFGRRIFADTHGRGVRGRGVRERGGGKSPPIITRLGIIRRRRTMG